MYAVGSRKTAAGHINQHGYRVVRRPGHPNARADGQILEHRLVMSDTIGRPLCADETVHHRNGVRDDNRAENLEIHVGPHAKGVLPADAVEWAHMILARYT